MEIKRYILTQGVLLSDNTLIPIWHPNLVFEKTEMYGNQIYLEGVRGMYYNTVECIYDLKTKQLSLGIEIDIIGKNSPSHNIGTLVLFEDNSQHILTKIVDIIHETYDLQIKKGKKVIEYYNRYLPKDMVIEEDKLYSIKIWKPTYVLENGKKTTYEMYLRVISNLDYLK
jgi:hypothetical protein